MNDALLVNLPVYMASFTQFDVTFQGVNPALDVSADIYVTAETENMSIDYSAVRHNDVSKQRDQVPRIFASG